MTFRVDRLVSEGSVIVLHVSGLVDAERVNTIKELIEEQSSKRKEAVQCQRYGITQVGHL